MASYHHSHRNHHGQNPVAAAATTATTTTTPYCCSCPYNHCCSEPLPPLQQLSIDPLLQALTFLLQQQQQQQQLPNSHIYLGKCHTQKYHHPNLHFQPQNPHFEHLGQDQQTHSVISSLLQRIISLESSLRYFFTSSVSNKSSHPSYSLREAAARIIQTHFRSFLVRRSRTLSLLQEIAFIKSRFGSLRSSISNKTHINYGMASQKAMDLLLKLDSIQGGNPMIRDGKRSISADIVRFLEFIDAVAVKRHGSSYRLVKNVRFDRNTDTSRASNSNVGYGGGSQKGIEEKLSDRVEKILGFSRACDNGEEDVELEGFQDFIDDDDGGDNENHKVLIDGKYGISKMRNGVLVKRTGGKPRVNKTVSFVEDGNVCRIFSHLHESVLKGDGNLAYGSDSSGDHGENVDSSGIVERKGSSKVTENDEVAEDDNAASSQSSDDGERNPTRNLRGEYYEINRCCQDQGGGLVFSAPLPVKMEPRADLMKKRKAVKIVT